MEFGIFNLMGSRDPEKPTAEVFAEVAEQTRLADELGYAIAWSWAFSSKCRSSAVRTGLAAGGSRIRTIGTA
jgi:alkanesulfonate monooxygenase SsuD/methylene tetrahydromethanopterin reductase-like flavin-dependent oxidoreductase (luciferase family)